jgi:glycosyltransferase involved in cell wall biosynthesis
LEIAKRKTLGVVAISYNEQEDLPGFLEHLTPWVDEVVLVDDGSTDKTEAIANSYGPKVKFLKSPRKEGEYYAQQRNKGIEAATSDWLLHMDVDERVPPELAQEIMEAIHSSAFKAYKFRRLNYFLHRAMRGGGWADWNLVHLAPRTDLRFAGMFHEEIKLQAKAHEVGQLKNLMHHLNDATYDERLQKSLKYQKEVAARIRESGKKISAWTLLLSFCKEFVYKYLYKKGYKDGTVGLLSAMHSAAASFKANALVWDEQNQRSRAQIEKELAMQWQNRKVKKPQNNG